jgi:hypothetical protein
MEAALSQDQIMCLLVASKGFQFLRWIDQVFKLGEIMYINVYFPTESQTEASHVLFTIHSLTTIAAIVILPRLASAAPALVRIDGACRALAPTKRMGRTQSYC